MDTIIPYAAAAGAVLLALLVVAYIAGLIQFYYNRHIIRLVTVLFEFGMDLRRRHERGELAPWQSTLAYLYVALVFLPADFYLQFKIAAEQAQVRPRFELTTSLIDRLLHEDKDFTVSLRKLLDAHGKKPVDGVRASTALQYFDIIDTRRGDTAHFSKANDFRSVRDPDRV